MEFDQEQVDIFKGDAGIDLIKLPELTEEEKNIVDPLVAPTSGLRIQLYDVIENDSKYFMRKRTLYLFLRVYRAIAEKFKEFHAPEDQKILLVTDDRPSKDLLLNLSSQIFAAEGFEVYHQQDVDGESKLSSPYGAASVALYEDIKLIIVITASHNELSWNGIKFYIDYPMPMSGSMFKDISKKALEYDEIRLKSDVKPIQIEAEQKNNDYIHELLKDVLEIKSIKGKNIILWPYLGKARGIVNLFKDYGANVTLIEETLNPPNPIKTIKEDKLQQVMAENNSDIALLLDADRDRIALYVKQDGKFMTYIPNEIYSALHNILATDFNRNIINVRTIPSDPRGDHTSFLNILTGVGYKHLGVILYFLMGVEVEQSKIDTAILYLEDKDNHLNQIDAPSSLKQRIIDLMEEKDLKKEKFIIVMWEESGGHTINILDVSRIDSGTYEFGSPLPLIADKYPVPALVLITELICRGYEISEAIDFSIVGINRVIDATDEEKIKIMKGFEENDGKTIKIEDREYDVQALSDNNGMIDIYQLKRSDATIYFRPSGTGPNVRFYIFGDRETYDKEIDDIMSHVEKNYK